jgi:signal transduction histidine kinase
MNAPGPDQPAVSPVIPGDMDSFRELLLEVSAELAGLDGCPSEGVITNVLGRLARAVSADRAFVLRFDPSAGTFSAVYEWDAPGVHSQLDYLVNLPMRAFAWSADRLLRNEPAAISRLDDYPPEAGSERALCEQEGIQSVLYVPMPWHGAVVGCLGFAALRQPIAWNANSVALLRIVGAAVSNVIMRLRTDRLLETLVQSAPDIRVLVDSEHRVLLASRSLLQKLNRSLEEVRGTPAYELFPAAVAVGRRAQADRAIATNRTVEFEDELFGRAWRNHITPISQPGDARPSMLAVHSHDITEERRLQHELLHVSRQALEGVLHDLHDTLAQQLVGLRYLADALVRQAEVGDHALLPQARQVRDEIASAVARLREILQNEMTLDEAPPNFALALRRLAQTTGHMFGAPVEVQAPEALDLPDKAVRNELYLIAREALSNALRHARGTHVVVGLATSDRRGVLRVADNGSGVAPPADAPGHFGQRIMQIRAASIGGTLTTDAQPGRGTTVTCTFPL